MLQPVSGQGDNTNAKIISNYAAGDGTRSRTHRLLERGASSAPATCSLICRRPSSGTTKSTPTRWTTSSRICWSPACGDGKLWSLPQETNADLPYTNLDVVRQAGLEPLRLGYSWEDLTEYLKAIQQTLGPGEQSGKWAMSGMMGNVNFINLLKQAGGEFYNADRTKIIYNSPEGVEALQYVADLIHDHQVHVPHRSYFEASGKDRPSFRKGSIAMNYETSASRLVTWAQDIGGLGQHVRHAVAHAEAALCGHLWPEHLYVQDEHPAAGSCLAGDALADEHGCGGALRSRDDVPGAAQVCAPPPRVPGGAGACCRSSRPLSRV